jgi:hypothetical protein
MSRRRAAHTRPAGVQGAATRGAPPIHPKHHFLHDPPSYKHLPTRNRIKKQHRCQPHLQHERARRQRAAAAPRAEGLRNAPQGESTTATPSTHPHNNVHLGRTGGDVPLPAFRQHTDAAAAHGGSSSRQTEGERRDTRASRQRICTTPPSSCPVYTSVGVCGGAVGVRYVPGGRRWRRSVAAAAAAAAPLRPLRAAHLISNTDSGFPTAPSRSFVSFWTSTVVHLSWMENSASYMEGPSEASLASSLEISSRSNLMQLSRSVFHQPTPLQAILPSQGNLHSNTLPTPHQPLPHRSFIVHARRPERQPKGGRM